MDFLHSILTPERVVEIPLESGEKLSFMTKEIKEQDFQKMELIIEFDILDLLENEKLHKTTLQCASLLEKMKPNENSDWISVSRLPIGNKLKALRAFVYGVLALLDDAKKK